MSGHDEAAAALLEATLRRVKPSKVVCIEAESGARVPVAVGVGKAARFRHTAAMIVSRLHEWARVDLLNARGEVMESWTPPTPAGADDAAAELAPELAAMPPGQDERVLAFGAALLGLVQRAVDHATDRHTASMRVANEGLALLLKSQSERLAVVEKQQTGMLKLAYDAVRVSAYHEGRAELGREVAQLQARVDGANADDPMQGMAQALMQRALGIGAPPAAPAQPPTEPHHG